MISSLSIGPIVVGSITFYVAVYHTFLYFRRRPQHREYLTFALACFSLTLFDVLCAYVGNSVSVAEVAKWQRFQVVVLSLFAIAFLWFISDYTLTKPTKLLYIFSGLFFLAAIVEAVDRSELTWNVAKPSIKEISLFGHKIVYHEATQGPFTNYLIILEVLAIIYIFWMAFAFYKKGHRKKAKPLLHALALFFAGMLNDTAVSSGLYHFIYLTQYTFLGMILLMAYSISNNLIEAGIIKNTLKANEERFRSIVENSHDGIVILEDGYLIKYVNNRGCQIIGYTWEELINQPFFKFLDRESKKMVNDFYIQNDKGENIPYQYQFGVITKNGERRQVETKFTLIKDSTGKLKTIAQILDITERVRAEQALKQSEENYRNLFTTAHDAIMIFTPEHEIILDVNHRASEMYGFSRDELIGMSLKKISKYVARGRERIKQTLEKGFIHGFETVHYKKDGTEMIVEINASLMNYNGQPAILSINRDITERKKKEKELSKYRKHLLELVKERTAELETVNKELKDFAYIVSHDLKAPLRGVSQLAHWIVQDYSDVLDEAGKEQLNLLIGRVKRMHSLIDAILKYSRIGVIEEKTKRINTKTLVKNLIEMIAPPSNIEIIIDENLPVIFGEETRLEQIFQNLLTNAINFMDKPNGKIKVSCIDHGNHWQFSVSDNGPGIEQKYHEKIFQIFQTLAPRDDRESTGVGLTLVKKNVEMCGGKVWVDSEIGKGSTFSFTLPKRGGENEEQKTNSSG